MTRQVVLACFAMLAVGAVGAQRDHGPLVRVPADESQAGTWSWLTPGTRLAPGTPIEVRLSGPVSSETANPGDRWVGVLAEPVMQGDRLALHTNDIVHGVVRGVRRAHRGEGPRAMVELAVTEIEGNGRAQRVSASTEPVVAGSTASRDLGAIAGGTLAGALLGKAIGGDDRDAMAGGVLGGAAAAGALASAKGYPVVLEPGTTVIFTIDERVASR